MADPTYAIVNGAVVPYAAATVHVDAPGIAFAAAVFEGLRAYKDPTRGSLHVFRLKEHVHRLMVSMRILHFEHQWQEPAVCEQVLEAIRVNGYEDDSYIRILAYIEGACTIGTPGPVSLAVTARSRGRSSGAERGLKVGVSSWTRISDNAMPARVKATANYVNSRLAVMQMRAQGFDSALLLGPDGKVTEAYSSCFFMVRNGVLITPPVTSGILESVTRATVMELHAALTGTPVLERAVDRSELYVADEIFFCGTGQEVVPVLSVDQTPVGDGAEGPVTRAIRERYFAVGRGITPDHAQWRTPVRPV
jgi:branched-chain amino acid aminotransferase